jgi:beta-glucanase (GH16 family)
MRAGVSILTAFLFTSGLLGGCGGGSTAPSTPMLTFAAIPAQTYGAAPFTVSASSASSGAITYSVTSGSATISGATVTLTGVGSVTLGASQAASGNYTAATASTSFTINGEAPTLTFAAIATQTVGNAPFTVSASSASSGAITYSVTSGPATISGATVTLTGAGTVDLQASQAASGDYASATATTSFTVSAAAAAMPSITTSASNGAQNGAVIATLASTTAGATVYYTLDGSAPTAASQAYLAPILVASDITINAIAVAPGYGNSAVATQVFSPNIASGTLVWSDEFANSTASPAEPNPATWTYDTGTNCCGNNEWEDYCSWNSSVAPCNPASPNAFVGTDGYLHIVAQQTTPGGFAPGDFTSARLKSEGLFSFQYGRIEARLQLPESQGMWPAFWLLGNNISTINWPACGELDVMEHIDGDDTPFGGPPSGGAAPGYDWTQSSIHGTGLNGGTPYTTTGFSAAAWHTYGMIWSEGQIQYYVDSPTNIYETFTPSSPGGGTWPFDQGPQFILLNLAVGGSWPGNPDSTTVFPSSMLVDYVRIYAN